MDAREESEIYMGQEFCDIAAARFVSASERQYADWLKKRGAHVVLHRGRYWEKIAHGFYEPVHWMARLKTEEVSRPALACWGYRASLHESAAGLANCTMPMNLLSDVENYTLENLPAKRRTDLRKSQKRVSVLQLTSPKLLQDQGYDVSMSAFQRTGYGTPHSRQEYYQSEILSFPNQPFQTVIAGLVDGKLGGYVKAYAIEDTMYVHIVKIATEFLSTAIGTGIIFDLVQACRRNESIKHVVYGLHSPEDPRLIAFKEGMGFKTVTIPSHVWMLPGLRTVIRKKKPYAFYRLTGILSEATPKNEKSMKSLQQP